MQLNLSTALTAGPLPNGSLRRAAKAPALPPRRATAAAVSASQPPHPAASEWREQLSATMQAFEGRSRALSAELSDVRLQMEAMAASS